MSTKPPFTIGAYDVLEILRQTPNFVDYRAIHRSPPYLVRLRNDDPSGRYGQGNGFGLFLEARGLQARMHHPNILPVKDVFEHGGATHTVFQHVEGLRRLGPLLADARSRSTKVFELEPYVRLCEGVTSALSAIHAHGFLHGSIGKGLILVDESWNPLVEDLAFAVPQAESHRQAFGVPRYMAPEQLRPERERRPTTASDIYALGVLLFEIRYGRHPVPGPHGRSRADTFAKLAGSRPAFPQIEATDGSPVADLSDTIDGREITMAQDVIRMPDHALEEERHLRAWLASLLAYDVAERESSAREATRALRGVALRLADRPPVATAFIVMPFDGFSGLGDELRSACLERRLHAVRGDELFQHDSVWQDIAQGIRTADFVIAVCFGTDEQFNANVMVELGLALGKEKPVLIVTDDPETLPFDLRSLRAVACPSGDQRDPAFRLQLRRYLDELIARLGRAES